MGKREERSTLDDSHVTETPPCWFFTVLQLVEFSRYAVIKDWRVSLLRILQEDIIYIIIHTVIKKTSTLYCVNHLIVK